MSAQTALPLDARTRGGSVSLSVVLPCLLLFLSMLNLTLVVAGLKELVIDDLGGTARDASLFFSIEMVAYIVFAPVWGLLSDRWGRRRALVTLGFLLCAPLYALYSIVASVPALLSLRFVQGAFAVMGWSSLMALVLDQVDEKRRGRFMGLMGGSLILGVALGAPLGGYVSRHLGARAPLQLSALLFLLMALASLSLREPAQHIRQVALPEIARALRERPRLLLPWLFYFVDRYTVGFFVVLFPLYLGSLGVEDPAVRGRYLALFLLPFAFLQYFTGRLSERTGPYPPLLVGSLLYGAVLCAVGYSDLHALWYVMIGLGALAAVMFPPTLTLTGELSDARTRGSAMGGFNLAGSLGFALGPVVGAWAQERAGFGFAFVVAGALEITVVLVTLGILAAKRGNSS
jgi:MFS family permease